MKFADVKKLRQWYGRSEQQSKLFTFVWHGFLFVLIPQLIITAACRHYSPSSRYDCSAQGVIVRPDTIMDPWHDLLASKERRQEIIKNMHDNCALQNRLKQCTSDTCSRRNHAVPDRLFQLMGMALYLVKMVWLG